MDTRSVLRHLVFQDHELIWDSDHPFPQKNLQKFLMKQGECKCPFSWECPRCKNDCKRCEELR
jgi:hypothetical protein